MTATLWGMARTEAAKKKPRLRARFACACGPGAGVIGGCSIGLSELFGFVRPICATASWPIGFVLPNCEGRRSGWGLSEIGFDLPNARKAFRYNNTLDLYANTGHQIDPAARPLCGAAGRSAGGGVVRRLARGVRHVSRHGGDRLAGGLADQHGRAGLCQTVLGSCRTVPGHTSPVEYAVFFRAARLLSSRLISA